MNTTIRVPHAGADTHTVVFAVEVDDDVLASDEDLLDRLTVRFRAEVGRAIGAHRYRDHLAEFLGRCRFSLDDLRARDDRAGVAAARQELMWLLRQAGWSSPNIGKLLDRDHSTVLHGAQQWEAKGAVQATRDRYATRETAA